MASWTKWILLIALPVTTARGSGSSESTTVSRSRTESTSTVNASTSTASNSSTSASTVSFDAAVSFKCYQHASKAEPPASTEWTNCATCCLSVVEKGSHRTRRSCVPGDEADACLRETFESANHSVRACKADLCNGPPPETTPTKPRPSTELGLFVALGIYAVLVLAVEGFLFWHLRRHFRVAETQLSPEHGELRKMQRRQEEEFGELNGATYHVLGRRPPARAPAAPVSVEREPSDAASGEPSAEKAKSAEGGEPAASNASQTRSEALDASQLSALPSGSWSRSEAGPHLSSPNRVSPASPSKRPSHSEPRSK